MGRYDIRFHEPGSLPLPPRRGLRDRLRADFRAALRHGAGGERLLALRARGAAAVGVVASSPRRRGDPPGRAIARQLAARRPRASSSRADLGVWHWSIVYTSVANSTLLANLAPIFVTLAGWLFWRRKVTRTFLVGMLLAIAGMFVLVGPELRHRRHARSRATRWARSPRVFYAGYLLAIKARATRAPPPRG